MSLFEFYPKYSSFKEHIKTSQYPMATWKIILLYPIDLLIIFLVTTAVISVVKIMAISERLKYPSSRYKKVVRKGVLWDTTEYHER